MTTIGNLFQNCKITGRFNVGIAAVSRWYRGGAENRGFLAINAGSANGKIWENLHPFTFFLEPAPAADVTAI